MSESLPVSAGDDILASAYNNLRKDVLDNGVGHYHTGAEDGGRQIPESSLAFDVATQAELDATMNTTTGHDHNGTNSKLLSSGLYGCRAKPDATQAISANTYTKIILATETFDIQNEFTDSRYTATTEGYYQVNVVIHAQANGTSSADSYAAYIYKNGVEYSQLYLYVPDLTRFRFTFSDTVYLAINDYIEFYCWTNNTTLTNEIVASGTFISIMKIKSVA